MSQRDRPAEHRTPLRPLEAVFSRYSPELYRYILRRLRRAEQAADLTQEIFERFLKGSGAGKALNPRAYLFGIAANVVADARLAEGKDPVTYDSEHCDALSGSVPDPAPSPVEQADLQQELKAALAQLPDMHRAAFLLTKWEGLSIRETAARMKLTEGSVMVYVCEARARLRTLLKHRHGQGGPTR